ncbi:MAG TPA: DUF3383 family protein, partial [Leptospiraceae bacterium]|nr:DUF3383 family protein [Leptospiraceae bacterium]
SLQTLPLAQKGFGMPLIVGTKQPSNLDTVGAINNVAGYPLGVTTIVVDGFADSGNPIAANDEFVIAGETGSPVHTVVSTSKTSNNTTSITFTPALASSVADNAVVTVTKEKQDVYVEVADQDELLTLGYSSTDDEYKMAKALFSQSPRVEKVAVCYISSFANLETELAELRNEGKDAWYYLLITSRAKADIAIADSYINALEKIGVFASNDQTITSTGDRTVIIISNNAGDFPDAAIVGRCAAEPIGSITWDSKQMSGQNNSQVTMSEQSTLLAKNFNLIREMGGVDVFWEGKTASGQYIDVIQGRDYLKARLAEALYSLKINSKKIPAEQRGVDMVEASIREVFREAGRQGVVAGISNATEAAKSDLGDFQYKLTMPVWAELPFNDRANRKIPISFTATVGGGINTIQVNGVMGV